MQITTYLNIIGWILVFVGYAAMFCNFPMASVFFWIAVGIFLGNIFIVIMKTKIRN